MIDEEMWYDDAAGPLVRPYTLTKGRTRTRRVDLTMITLVVAARPLPISLPAVLGPEHRQMIGLCREATSIAELSAQMSLPLSVVKILLEDLIEYQLVVHRSAAAPDLQVLQAVINGIRRL